MDSKAITYTYLVLYEYCFGVIHLTAEVIQKNWNFVRELKGYKSSLKESSKNIEQFEDRVRHHTIVKGPDDDQK